MPTARPIISASVGVVEEMVVTDATVRIPPMVMPTPSTAVSSGSPAARSEREGDGQDDEGDETPIRSVRPMPAPVLVYMSPPSVTVNFAPGGGLRRLLDLGDGGRRAGR